MARWGLDAEGNYVPLADGQQSAWNGSGTVQGDASGSAQTQPGPAANGAGAPYYGATDPNHYLDPGVTANQFGFSRYDAVNDIAYDENGQPIVDDGSNPELTSRLQQVRDAASARKLEFGSRAGAIDQLGQVGAQTGNVYGAKFGENLPGMQYGTQQRISEAAQAARALGAPVTNAGDIAGAYSQQNGFVNAIPGSDAANAARQNGQLDEYGGDLGKFRSDIDILRQTALGKGPSAAQALAAQQLGESTRAMSALGATARGGNVAAGLRGAMRAGTDMMLRSQQQMAALRAQEQLTGQAQLANAQSQLATAQGQRGGVLNAARTNDIVKATQAAAAADAMSGKQLGLGELETTRQMGRATNLGATAATQNNATNTAAEIARNEEDARQSRARMALDAYSTLATGGMAPYEATRQREHERKIQKEGQSITGKDVLGGVFSLGGAALGAAGSIFKPGR
jgi:hypothetical protein